ncbi:MAG: hypothetical protein JNL70_25220 [Saprospiraceae bacterium]|nr:hypothetical protein [Saprospiraceae bacterium]
MKQYVIHALDGTDDDALNRRLSVRAAHFENMSRFKANGNFILGGAMLDERGQMMGSTVVMQFDSEDEFREYLDSEPYIRDKVWVDIRIYPFKTATVV